MCQDCHVDEAGCYTDGASTMLTGKNVLSEGNNFGINVLFVVFYSG